MASPVGGPGHDGALRLGGLSGEPTGCGSGGSTRGRHLSQDAAEMRALFSALDKDRNGYIDKNELRLTMSEVGLELSPRDLDTMMKAAGVVIKDRIFYEDFVKMMTGKIGQSQRKVSSASRDMTSRGLREPSTYSLCGGAEEEEEPDVQAMRVAFSMFDLDGDGLISEQEVHDTMTSLGIKISIKDVKMIVRKVDADCNGSISFEKFLAAMKRYQTSGALGGRGDTGEGEVGGGMSRSPCRGTGESRDSVDVLDLAPPGGGCGIQDLIDTAFRVFDKDKDGFLNAQDLRSTMEQLGLVLSESDIHAMMKSVGIGPHGKISHHDFCRIYSSKTAANAEKRPAAMNSERKITKRQETEMRAVFDVFDMDRDGFITMDEVVEVLVSMGFHPSHDCITEVFHQVDLDGNGKIDFSEFRLLVRKYERPLPENIEMREMFNALDKDRNGIVDRDELKTSFAELGVPLTDEDVLAMMKEACVQGNKIYYEDFVRIMSGQLLRGGASPIGQDDNKRVRSSRTSAHHSSRKKSGGSGGLELEPPVISSHSQQLLSAQPSRSNSSKDRSKSNRGSSSRSSSSRRGADGSGSRKDSTASGVSPSRSGAAVDDVIDRADVVQAMPGDLERAIMASLEAAAAASRVPVEQEQQQRLHTNHDRKTLEVEEFFRESLTPEGSPIAMSPLQRQQLRDQQQQLQQQIQPQQQQQQVQQQTQQQQQQQQFHQETQQLPRIHHPQPQYPQSQVQQQHQQKQQQNVSAMTSSGENDILRRKKTSTEKAPSTWIAFKVQYATEKARNTWVAFKVFDRNSDGYISKQELHRTMIDLGIPLSKDDLDVMMAEADINKDGRIDYAEFSKLMNGSFEAYATQAAHIQNKNQTTTTTSPQTRTPPSHHSNGSVTSHAANNTSAFRAPPPSYPPPSCPPPSYPPPFYPTSAPQQTSTPLKQLPAPVTSPTSPTSCGNHVVTSPMVEDDMRAAFRVFDIDGDGLIDADELRLTMMNLGETLTDDDVTAMINVVDRNDDGKVDYEEFIQLMRLSN